MRPRKIVSPTLSVVIPAEAGIQDERLWIPGQARNDIEERFRVKPGMTKEKVQHV
jgi:hypothetical protein